MISSQITALMSGVPDGLVSLGVGLMGVALARWVFINRENRRLPRAQKWTDSLPLTLIAMLITAVIVVDRDLGLSAACFVGLGVGWTAVLILDVLGERAVSVFRAGFAVQTPPEVKRSDVSGKDGKMDASVIDIPTDMAKLIDEIDRGDKVK